MITITFHGIVVSRSIDVDSELVVCCASRIAVKDWRVISLEGKFADKPPDFRIESGMLVAGKAYLVEIWDGSILVQFMTEEFQILSSNNPTDFDDNLLKYVYDPRSERKIALAGKEFYRFRLDEIYHPHQIKWNQRRFPLGALSLAMSTEDGASMAAMTGYALLLAKTRIKYGKWNRKVGIFLLANMTTQTHTPILMFAEADIGEAWQRGGVYSFTKLPILYNNDTLRSSPAGEAESTVYCCKAKFMLVHNPDDEILSFLYHELGNVANMPEWLWDKYFKGRIVRKSLVVWQMGIGKRLEESGKLPGARAYGWWHSWCHATTLKDNGLINGPIAILTPDFADGGEPRVIALPESIYKANRKSFPENSTVVSVSADPEIIGGAWCPDPQSWELITNWIRTNEAALKKEIIFAGDFKDPNARD